MGKQITTDYSIPARTRIAPSPTGELHLGTLRCILYDYALAKKTNGQFIFRIENTDTKRYVVGAEERLAETTKAYGLNWDEGIIVGGLYEPYDQLERVKKGIYKKEIDRLINDGNAYRCFCTAEELEAKREIAKAKKLVPMYDKTCRKLTKEEVDQKLQINMPFTIRIKMPVNETIEFTDVIRGKMKWNSNDVDDYIIVKSDGIPTYHGAANIDDNAMKITHVFRAAEWLPTTPVYITMSKYLGYELPQIAHLSVLLSPVGKGKMSKRKNGELVFARSYLDKGYPPQAILNYLMFLGWSHTDEKVNLLSLEEFCKVFSLERLQPQPQKMDFAKIDFYGGQYIRMMNSEELYNNVKYWIDNIEHPEIKANALVWQDRINLQPHEYFKDVLKLLQDRLRKYSDLFDTAEFFYSEPVSDRIEWDKTKHLESECKGVIPGLKKELESCLENNLWSQEKWENIIRGYADICRWKQGDMFMLLRLCIVGSPFSPNLLQSMNLIGSTECLHRLDFVL